MDNSNIILKITNNHNFKDVIKICLENNIDMEYIYNKINPEINVYHYNKYINSNITHSSCGDGSAYWIHINLNKCSFYINDNKEELKGVNNFFKYFENIHTIIVKNEIFKVKFEKYYQHDDLTHEYSFHLHSYDSPAYKNLKEQYYFINGEYQTKKDFLHKQRKYKLKRILK